MSYTATELAKKAGVSPCTLNRHLRQELVCAVWSKISIADKRGRKHSFYGWLFSDAEAKRYIAYLESLVGFRSDGRLPSKRIGELFDSGFSVEEIARETKIKPASVKSAIARELKRRKKWQAQNSSQVAQT